jgi:Flp pilus assembly protein TadG
MITRMASGAALMAMDQSRAFPPRRRLLPARGGNIGILIAVMFPMLIGFVVLGVDVPYLYYRNLILRQTVQAAALAGGNQLTTYYTSGNSSTAAIVTAAQTFAQANMPVSQYGTVVPASTVTVGNWNAAASTFTSLAASGGVSPDAVQVTGLTTTANGNPVTVFFGGVIGRPTYNLTSTATVSFGTGQTFNTIIINDLTQSFSSEIANQQAADLAILNCVKTSSGSASQFGVTSIDGHSVIQQPLVQASTNLTAIQNLVASLNSCGNTGMPVCSGSNVAAGIYSAIQQFSGPAYANTKNNIIVITDGVPNADNITYTQADGIYPTPSSTTPTCTTNCADADLLTMAQNQAAVAKAAGISISTIYYSGDTPSGQQASYAAALATLVGGTGVAMVAPSASQINTTFGGFCATMSSALKMVN